MSTSETLKPTLRELQEKFSQAVCFGDGVEDVHRLLNAPSLPAGDFSAQTRFSVYKNGYFQRIFGSLEEDFSLTQEALGSDSFKTLIKEYLKSHGSRFWSIAEVGSRLGEFVENSHWSQEYPYLKDMVSLEWCKILSGLVAVPPLADFSKIAQYSEEDQQNIILKLNPSLYFLASAWQGTTAQQTWFVVYQANGETLHEELPQDHWTFLKSLQERPTLGRLSEIFVADKGEDVSQGELNSLSTYFAVSVEKQLIVNFELV